MRRASFAAIQSLREMLARALPQYQHGCFDVCLLGIPWWTEVWEIINYSRHSVSLDRLQSSIVHGIWYGMVLLERSQLLRVEKMRCRADFKVKVVTIADARRFWLARRRLWWRLL